jgi:hypothetical protein
MNYTSDSKGQQSDPGETPGMDLPSVVLEMPSPRRRKRSWMRRIAVACFSLVFMLGVALAGLFAVLSNGPVEVGFLSERIAVALEERLGSGIDVSVGRTVLEKNDRGLELHIRDVVLKDPANREILRSPDALVAFDPLQLATLRLSPRALSFKGVTLTAIITAQNEIILSATPNPALADQPQVDSSVRAEEIGTFLMAMSRAGPGRWFPQDRGPSQWQTAGFRQHHSRYQDTAGRQAGSNRIAQKGCRYSSCLDCRGFLCRWSHHPSADRQHWRFPASGAGRVQNACCEADIQGHDGRDRPD